MTRRTQAALSEPGRLQDCFGNIKFTFGCVLPRTAALSESSGETAQSFLRLARKYCDREDPLFNNDHFREGKTRDPALGFADCALPVVLEHNTPNNSMALLWAETGYVPGIDEIPGRYHMTALFRRRQRHV